MALIHGDFLILRKWLLNVLLDQTGWKPQVGLEGPLRAPWSITFLSVGIRDSQRLRNICKFTQQFSGMNGQNPGLLTFRAKLGDLCEERFLYYSILLPFNYLIYIFVLL